MREKIRNIAKNLNPSPSPSPLGGEGIRPRLFFFHKGRGRLKGNEGGYMLKKRGGLTLLREGRVNKTKIAFLLQGKG